MEATLTGRDATEALKVYTDLGALGARFDGTKVRESVVTAAGRLRLRRAIRFSVRPVVSAVFARRPGREPRSRVSRVLRASRTGASPGRPRSDDDDAEADSASRAPRGVG